MPESSRSYQQEDLQEILNLAIARQGGDPEFTREQLVEIASEMGISTTDLQKAEQEWLVRQGETKERQEFTLYRRRAFQKRLMSYIFINGFLVTINLATASTISWAWYILGFWGLGLGMKAWNVFSADGVEDNEAFYSWRRKQQIRQTVNSLWNRFNRFLDS
jgi:hypothetical protein